VNDKTADLTGLSTGATPGTMAPGVTLSAESLSIKTEFGPVAMSIDGPTRSEINDFIGKSRSIRLPDGRLLFEVSDKPLQAGANEPNVRKALAEALSAPAGESLSCRPATDAENDHGVDGYVTYSSGMSVPVQIVKTPSQKEYGVAVAKGLWRIVVTVDEAANWIKSTIDHKSKKIAPADRANMILALDVRHAGQLVNVDVIASFARQMPNVAQLGFRAIWLVGSTPVGSKRIA
jgi:hypothetical protein